VWVFGLLIGVAGTLPLVGRRSELALVIEALVADSGPHALVLVGEAGVGKTRLVTEAVAAARAAGATALMGGCLPLTDSVPFLPLTESLRDLGTAPAALDRCAPHVRLELARLVPGWSAATPPGSLEGWERGRLFSALRDLLTAVRCALVIEDVHWADATTLDFLSYLAAVDRAGAVRIVVTCREEQSRPIGRWLVEFARGPAVSRILLGRLSRSEVADQVGGLLGRTPHQSYVDDVFDRAGGNAFFTEQLVAAGGARLPASLAQLLLARTAVTSVDSRDVLAALAVAGRGLDEPVLASATGLSSVRLGDAVHDLVEAWLIDRPDDGFRLRHALVGEAIVDDMLPGDRRERHRRMALALTAADAPGEVAGHWAAAGEIRAEMPCRIAAARQAESVFAYREAARHWERVIKLWPLLPGEAHGTDLTTAYLKALDALERCGDTRRAARMADDAVRTLAPILDRRNLVLLHTRAGYLRENDAHGAGLSLLEETRELVADLPDGEEKVLFLLTYGEALWSQDRADEAHRYLAPAMEISPAFLPRSDLVAALYLLAWNIFDRGDVDVGMRLVDRVSALIDQVPDHPAATFAASERAQVMLLRGRLQDAEAEARSGLDLARRSGLEQHAAAQLLRSHVVESLAERGRHLEAVQMINAATESPPTSGASYDHMVRADLDLLAGDLDAATGRWPAIETITHPANLNYGGNLVGRGLIDIWSRRPEVALRRIRQLPHRLDSTRYRFFAGPILTTALWACADLAETARANRDAAAERAARRSADDLLEIHRAMRYDPFAAHPFYVTRAADGATWAAELTRLDGKSDPLAWSAAADAWTDLGRPHRIAHARWRQGEALLASGRAREARDCLREAAAAASTHVPLLAAIHRLARLARLDLAEPQPEATSTPFALTPREFAVLRLVAEGLTNTEIGGRLFISNKTASVHVTNILRKLEVSNRAQAAAVAQRAGLLD